MSTKLLMAASGLAALLLASPAVAQHAGKHDAVSKAKEADQPDADSAAGSTAAFDTATGKLRALTREEARALIDAMAPSLNQSAEGLSPVLHPDGTVSMDLQGRFESVSLARVRTDDSVATRCVSTVGETEQFLGVDPKARPSSTARKGGDRGGKNAGQPARTAPPASGTDLEEK
jgi:hypothetical protein